MEKVSNLASTTISPSHLAVVLEQNKAFPSLSIVGLYQLHQRHASGYRQLCRSITKSGLLDAVKAIDTKKFKGDQHV
jgi:hypothetical protein